MGRIRKMERRTTGSKGQGLVEFALVLPLLLIVAVGVLDLGRIFFVLITVSNASREGARYLSFNPDDIAYAGDPFHDTKAAAVQEASGSIITLTPANVVPSCSATITIDGNQLCAAGSTATVTVNYQLDLVAGWVLPSPITLSRFTKMVVP
jgi:Flp pilus assembly protein TadG